MANCRVALAWMAWSIDAALLPLGPVSTGNARVRARCRASCLNLERANTVPTTGHADAGWMSALLLPSSMTRTGVTRRDETTRGTGSRALRPCLDEYYRLRGWHVSSRPAHSATRLESLDFLAACTKRVVSAAATPRHVCRSFHLKASGRLSPL